MHMPALLPHWVGLCCAGCRHVVPTQQPPAQFAAVQLGTVTHWPFVHVWPLPQPMHALPLLPHCVLPCCAACRHVVPLQQPLAQLADEQLPGVRHCPFVHAWLELHCMHPLPPLPHWVLFCCAGLTHVPLLQQPAGQLAAVQPMFGTQRPFMHWLPETH
jgi:hypothetical protein